MDKKKKEKRKVHFDIVIPEEFDIGEIVIYKREEELRPKAFEDFEDDDGDDPDYVPEDDGEPDIYEDTPLTEEEKEALQQELENLIEDQQKELDLEWQEFKNEK